MEVFKSALQQNDPLEVSRRLAAIYKDSNKIGVWSEFIKKTFPTISGCVVGREAVSDNDKTVSIRADSVD